MPLIRPLAALAAAALATLVGCASPGTGGPTPDTARAPGPDLIVGRPGRAGPTAEDRRLGERVHPEIVAAHGGIYEDPALDAWLEGIVARIDRAGGGQPGLWQITLLDTPKANAFAVPGGYLYVTRGLLALANDEDELASVIAHEMAHVDARHLESRQRRATEAQGIALLGLLLGGVTGADAGVMRGIAEAGQVAGAAYVADFSREQEFEADRLGIGYITAAGYDPLAAADFLVSLQAQDTLQARIAGRQYDPNRVDFLSSHPATAERVRAAASTGRSVGGGGQGRDREGYLSRLDGMIYGDPPSQGYVRDGGFVHPELRFGFRAPRGFRITNSSRAVTAVNDRGATFVLEGAPDYSGPLTRFIAERWAPAIAREAGGGRISGLEPVRINGLDAARAVMPVRTRQGTADMLMVAVRLNGQIYRLTGIAPRGSGLLGEMEAAALSFRELSPAEAAQLQPLRLEVVRVRAGDTAASLAARMRTEGFAEERFRVLNGLGPADRLRPGMLVKIVR